VRNHDRLRIGYVSGDFRRHATTQLAAELFEAHDRSRFEIFAYAYGPNNDDAMRARLRAGFDRFIDITGHSTAEAADAIRRDEIDILIDLKGYTFDARTKLFALRPAPIQVNYLGYPGTMGASFIDYIVADAVVIPPGAERLYSEKIVRLPGCYQPNDSTRPLAPEPPPRAALGLPEDGFVFCCFNQTYKITPDIFGVWMALLRELPGSVLWLIAFNKEAPVRLKAMAKAQGVDPARLIVGPQLPPNDHLARLGRADLFLDTHPCAAHTTASDALWAGVPVLTLAGQVFQSRVAASLLTALGLEELITDSLPAYHAMAKRLAADPAFLRDLRDRLARQRTDSDLFSGRAIARKLESAFAEMWRRHSGGLAPDIIDPGAH
jgi:predicted O-linked N-acetylglucosamine transferase (SPINDLY family)